MMNEKEKAAYIRALEDAIEIIESECDCVELEYSKYPVLLNSATRALQNASQLISDEIVMTNSERVLSMGEQCVWKEDEDGVWDTECGNSFELVEGVPIQDEMNFCPYCGKALREETFTNNVKCTCGMPWEKDMNQFGCWSCGALKPNTES